MTAHNLVCGEVRLWGHAGRMARKTSLGFMLARVVTLAIVATAGVWGQMVERFEGRLMVGREPAPPGSVITLVTSEAFGGRVTGNPNLFECGRGIVTDRDGRYQLDIPALRGCVKRTTTDATVHYVFVYRGENVGTSWGGACLDQPMSLGRTQRKDLQATPMPERRPGFNEPGGTMPSVRFYGTLDINHQKAALGTIVKVVTSVAPDYHECGSGVVVRDGQYWVDIAAVPGCVRRHSDELPIRFIFLVEGTAVGSVSGGGVLDDPSTLGRVQQLRLAK
jgi:hypothetical protein